MTRLHEMVKTQEAAMARQPNARSGRKRNDDYRTLLSNVVSLENGYLQEELALGVVSGRAGEGCTTIARNLAACAASMTGGRVLLVDANMADPALHRMFRLGVTPGLQDFLSGDANLADCIQPTRADNLSVVAAGAARRRWFRRAGKRTAAEFVDAVKRDFWLTIVDLPPVLARHARLQLTESLDKLVLVVEAGRARARETKQVQVVLARTGVRVCGVVVNKGRQGKSRRSAANGKP